MGKDENGALEELKSIVSSFSILSQLLTSAVSSTIKLPYDFWLFETSILAIITIKPFVLEQ